MSDQFTSSQPTRYSLHHSYVWLSALRALPYIFAAVLFLPFQLCLSSQTMLQHWWGLRA